MQQRQLVKQSPIRSSYMAYSRHYGRVYAVESTLELDYLNLTLFQRAAESVESQPSSIQFHLDGRPRRYTPDFLVVEGGVRYVVEVKTRSATNKPEFQRKAIKLKGFFRERGEVFRVLTEDDIRPGNQARNLRFLMPVLDTPPPISEFESLLDATDVRTASMQVMNKLLNDLRLDISFIRRAVAHQLLQCDLTKPWSEMQFTW